MWRRMGINKIGEKYNWRFSCIKILRKNQNTKEELLEGRNQNPARVDAEKGKTTLPVDKGQNRLREQNGGTTI